MFLALRVLLAAAGAMTGYNSGRYIIKWLSIPETGSFYYVSCIIVAGLIAIIFFIASGHISKGLEKFYDKAELIVKGLTIVEAGIAFAGLVAGLAVSFFITLPFVNLNWLGLSIAICLNFLFGYIGLSFALWKRHDITGLKNKPAGLPPGAENISEPGEDGAEANGNGITADPELKSNGVSPDAEYKPNGALPGNGSVSNAKLLDTSVIIDGRIVGVIKAGFLEGRIIIPEFILAELRSIAGSQDDNKRAKGRYGVENLEKLKAALGDRLIFDQTQLPEGIPVDSELSNFALRHGYTILTTDYNLNKTAAVQGVNVLNINGLLNSVTPNVIPGDELSALIVRSGKEPEQGVAYLPDGTMIVVENGKQFINKTVEVTVTQLLQQNTGRMLFAKLSARQNGDAPNNNH